MGGNEGNKKIYVDKIGFIFMLILQKLYKFVKIKRIIKAMYFTNLKFKK